MIRTYVALGDSSTEGLEDALGPAGRHLGWADRVAAGLARTEGSLRYADLASAAGCSTRWSPTQLPVALALAPDLVSFHAGPNDVLRPRADLPGLLVGTTPPSAGWPRPGSVRSCSPSSSGPARADGGPARGAVQPFNDWASGDRGRAWRGPGRPGLGAGAVRPSAVAPTGCALAGGARPGRRGRARGARGGAVGLVAWGAAGFGAGEPGGGAGGGRPLDPGAPAALGKATAECSSGDRVTAKHVEFVDIVPD